MIEKFKFLAGRRLDLSRIEEVMERVLNLEKLSRIEDLTTLLSTGG
jgi:hypothetical protein